MIRMGISAMNIALRETVRESAMSFAGNRPSGHPRASGTFFHQRDMDATSEDRVLFLSQMN